MAEPSEPSTTSPCCVTSSPQSSIVSAVHAAEEMAGETIHGVLVNISDRYLASNMRSVEVPIAGHEVGDADLRRARLIDAQEETPPRIEDFTLLEGRA